MSRICKSSQRLFTKLELNHTSGSHKYRAADFIIRRAIERGDIIPQRTTVIEKTGGNFGFGLLIACNKYQVDIELAVGLSFSIAKRNLLECLGAKLIGKNMLKDGLSPREVIEYHLQHQEEMNKSYYYTDQFNNADGVEAHRINTGKELASQLKEENIDKPILFVGCAGTGASFTGIVRGLMDFDYTVDTILVEPTECDTQEGMFADHRLEGMSVGVIPPFLDWSLVGGVRKVKLEEALQAQREFYISNGVLIGNTSAACFFVAKQVISDPKFNDHLILTIAYDSGLWYSDLTNLRSTPAKI